MKFRLTAVAAILAIAAVMAVDAVSGSGANTPPHIVLVYNGPAITNTHSAPNTPAFSSWCDSICVPTVTMPAIDAVTGRIEGTIYVWSKGESLSGPLKFGEFAWFRFYNGSVYADSGSGGTVGAVMPLSVITPTHITGSGEVAAGGGDGTIVGGTGRYAHWNGTYADRVFVELNLSGGANYYNQLFWSINPS
ncbi:MAG TPA: hypothetical protein VME01_03575 [Solirubrobacteraceae bacterium]|nr:hypothetical protein [Solirubrobacteraceae bacterium]